MSNPRVRRAEDVVREFVRGHACVQDLESLGIRFAVTETSYVEPATKSCVVTVSLKDIAEGIIQNYGQGRRARLWANVVVNASFIDFDSDSADWGVLGDVVWNLAFGNPVGDMQLSEIRRYLSVDRDDQG